MKSHFGAFKFVVVENDALLEKLNLIEMCSFDFVKQRWEDKRDLLSNRNDAGL